jgi:hypothetical protein
MIARGTTPDVHSTTLVHLSKPVRVFNRPVMRVLQIDFSTVWEAGFISEQKVLKEIAPFFCSCLIPDLTEVQESVEVPDATKDGISEVNSVAGSTACSASSNLSNTHVWIVCSSARTASPSDSCLTALLRTRFGVFGFGEIQTIVTYCKRRLNISFGICLTVQLRLSHCVSSLFCMNVNHAWLFLILPEKSLL